jgi:uncharacterized OB-fold protein
VSPDRPVPRPVPRPLPRPTPETAVFWDGTRAGELRVHRCRACGRATIIAFGACPGCASEDIVVAVASGAGRIVSAVVSHLPAPGREPPTVLAVVELDEGARLLTNIVDVAPVLDAVPPDLPVSVVFEPLDDLALPVFRPRRA